MLIRTQTFCLLDWLKNQKLKFSFHFIKGKSTCFLGYSLDIIALVTAASSGGMNMYCLRTYSTCSVAVPSKTTAMSSYKGMQEKETVMSLFPVCETLVEVCWPLRGCRAGVSSAPPEQLCSNYMSFY